MLEQFTGGVIGVFGGGAALEAEWSSSLEGKIASSSFVGINWGPYKTPRKIGEGPSSFLPSPKVLAAMGT